MNPYPDLTMRLNGRRRPVVDPGHLTSLRFQRNNPMRIPAALSARDLTRFKA